MFKQHYQRFLHGSPDRLHFAAHSHHYWPDVTRQAVVQYWDDSARLADGKWTYLWEQVIPKAQRHISRILDISHPEQIAFAPNTHEFVCRLFSCFELGRPVRVLTSDSEFHSFGRQAARWREAGQIELTSIPSQPVEEFAGRVVEECRSRSYDFIFVSHVFYNSGLVVDELLKMVRAIPEEPLIVVDGYHGFCALPTKLGDIEERVFYLAGGYKYAQAGEGAGFMHVPGGCRLRPVNTGWFASFGALSSAGSDAVQYSDEGQRFAGATFDPTGLYRFNAVMDLFEREGITVERIHEHVGSLQARFLGELEALDHELLCRDRLIYRPDRPHGHFLTFELPTESHTAELAGRLASAGIVVDHRGVRLRFGFGLYQDENDVAELFRRLARLLA
jgi:selenocysteine lyase/cysteine desulfurase